MKEIKLCGFGSVGFFKSFIPACSSVLLPFLVLHLEHAITTLSQVCAFSFLLNDDFGII